MKDSPYRLARVDASMPDSTCATCGGPLEEGFVTTTNGSGLFWAREATDTRLRPTGLEVLVPTGFMGTYSANAPAGRCAACGTILLRLKR
ncbi:MAG: hypothetical protein L3K17_00370 [Thermoplasmata archaeon]|nr:hypothetical protein [Thermoplasmata archaeon]